MKFQFLKNKTVTISLIIIAVTLSMFQQVHDITVEPIKIWDESSSAQLAVDMMVHKHYFVVYDNGVPEHRDTKPPLQLWLKVICYKIFGINVFAVRFPTIVANFLIMLVFIFFSLRFLKNPILAWALPFLIASTPGYMFYHVARTGDPDTLLALFVTCYMLSYIVLLEKYPVSKLKYLLFFGISIVLAVYTKSVAGLAPLAGIAVFTLIHPNGRKLLAHPEIYLTSIGVIVIILAYYIIRNIYDPGYLKSVMTWELGLFDSYPGVVKHPKSIFYFNYLQKTAFFPYFNYIPLVLIPLLFSKNNRHRRIILYALIGAGVFLFGESMCLTKNEWYIAPIYPFLWLLVTLGAYELILTIPVLIKHRKTALIVQILLAVTILYFTGDRYNRTFSRNKKNPMGYIYEPERPGKYLGDLKKRKPELKKLTAFTNVFPRQLKFYIKKYQYEDSTQVDIVNKIDEKDLTGRKVFVCDTNLLKQLEAKYHLRQLDSAKYCKLFLVLSPIDSTQNKNISPKPLNK